MNTARRHLIVTTLAGASAGLLLGSLGGCVPLVLGGVVAGGALVATDRRTAGAQLEDETIDLRGTSRVNEGLRGRGHVNLVSYNRQVLITGEVPTEPEKQLVQQIVSRVENVQGVINELGVMPNSSLTQRSSDSLVTGRVRAAMVDAKDLFANAFKVLTERDVVYLMGRVTQREADRATALTRVIPGVQRVVRVLQIITEEELQGLVKGAPGK